MKKLRTFVAHVEDRPGVLNRVASMFRRRNYNIISLNVGTTHEPGVSRLTVVIEADEHVAHRIEANLYKLIDVIAVTDVTDAQTVDRVLALLKVRAAPEQRAEVLQLAEVFRARVVDVAPDTLILEITGTQDKIDGLVAVLQPFGILELVHTGTVSMQRGSTPALGAEHRAPIVAA
ncbi:MAG: acetolactate synthase small subunit [Polyangiaceae bacterium]|nr:acetolactate synthase small subunit [Polyangiaceae bacterium]